MKHMAKWMLCALLAAALMLGCAVAENGNVTIAVVGQNGFEDYISSMFVWDGRLLLTSWDKMYVWQPGADGMAEVEGYMQLENTLYENMETGEDGETIYTIGEEVLELEEGEHISLYSELIPAGEKLYRRAAVYGEDSSERALLLEVRLEEDDLSFGDVIDLEDELTIDYGSGYMGIREIQNPCSFNGMIYALSYGEEGREMLVIDLEAEEVEVRSIDVQGDVQCMSAFTGEKLLLVELNYDVDPIETNLLVYDMEQESTELLGTIANRGWNTPCAIAYDEARSMIYYTLDGSVWRMPVGENGIGEAQEFGDMPLEIYSDAAAALLGDSYILSSYEGVVGRDVTLDKLPEQRLRVENLSYQEGIKSAYFPFTDAHPEYMVSISSSSSADTILQNMMNRSADVDIYTLDMSDGAFFTLLNRGFMAELGANDTLRAQVEAMYDSLKDAVMRDGEIYALPMSMYTNVIALNKNLLTGKLGYAEEALPADWPALFTLLADLAQSGKLEEYPEVSVFTLGYTQRDAQYNFFMAMMESYFLWLDQSEENLLRGSEVLLENCAAFEEIDWAALGLAEEFDFEDAYTWVYDAENILFDTTSVQPRYYYEENMEPMVLGIAEGEAPMLGLQVSAAFVNPFSTQREAAVEYLEMAFSFVEEAELIGLMPDKNDPIKSSYYEETLAYYDEQIALMQEELENEEMDEENRDAMMESLEEFIGYRAEYMEDGRWEVAPKDIERYRTYAQYGVVTRDSIWSSGAYTQVHQYLDGAISAQQLCQELEKTLQMQRLEGM